MTAHSARIAVFDLDGTITRHDTMLPYLAGWVRRHPARAAGLPRVPLQLLAYGAGGRDRGRLKERLLQGFMRGARRAAVESWTAEFVAATLATGLHARARASIDAERRAGARLVLLSASVDLYVPALGAALGFDETVCTGVAWDGEQLLGRLTTVNRRGVEKARVIATLRERQPTAFIAAYANARSDLPHLRCVDEPHVVNATRGLERAADRLGWIVERWG